MDMSGRVHRSVTYMKSDPEIVKETSAALCARDYTIQLTTMEIMYLKQKCCYIVICKTYTMHYQNQTVPAYTQCD